MSKKLKFKCPECGGNTLIEYATNMSQTAEVSMYEGYGRVSITNADMLWDDVEYEYFCDECNWRVDEIHCSPTKIAPYLQSIGAVEGVSNG